MLYSVQLDGNEGLIEFSPATHSNGVAIILGVNTRIKVESEVWSVQAHFIEPTTGQNTTCNRGDWLNKVGLHVPCANTYGTLQYCTQQILKRLNFGMWTLGSYMILVSMTIKSTRAQVSLVITVAEANCVLRN